MTEGFLHDRAAPFIRGVFNGPRTRQNFDNAPVIRDKSQVLLKDYLENAKGHLIKDGVLTLASLLVPLFLNSSEHLITYGLLAYGLKKAEDFSVGIYHYFFHSYLQ